MKQADSSLVCLTSSYISPLLLATIEQNNIPVHLEQRVKISPEYKLNLISQQDAISLFDKTGRLYLNSEDSLSALESGSANESILKSIRFFKDKYLFKSCFKGERDFLVQLDRSELESFVPPENRHLLVKPAVGFHSLGIRDFTGRKQWKKVTGEIVGEIDDFADVFNQGVLSSARFIVEDYLKGVELAADAYFNHDGKPVISCIYEHPFRDEQDTRDLVYHTSIGLIKKYYDKIMGLLEKISQREKIRNFPLHLEVRVNNSKVVPIEGNPLRFGGFGLADLPYHSFGINPYLMYFKNREPDWEKILNSEDENHYAFILGQRPDDFNPEKHGIDHQKYKQTFTDIIDYRMIDPAKYKFFSVAYAKSKTLEDLTSYLNMDFNAFRIVG